jgi:heme exporter protein D
MRNRTTLKRLATLYGLVQDARSAEMRRAIGLLAEVEEAIATQESMLWMANAFGRGALEQGDRFGWKQAGTNATLAVWSCEQLETIREERDALSETAKQRYRESRIQAEQMSKLLEHASRQAELIEGRRTQSIADDRFLSRRRWVEMRAAASAGRAGHGISDI